MIAYVSQIICSSKKKPKQTTKKSDILTLVSIVSKGVEYSHSDVDQTGQVEGDAPPKRDVA